MLARQFSRPAWRSRAARSIAGQRPPLPNDEFATDMAALARMERRLWIAARNTDGEPKPAIPELDLMCDFIAGCDSLIALDDAIDKFNDIDIAAIGRVA